MQVKEMFMVIFIALGIALNHQRYAVYASINVKPGGGGPRADVGYLTSIAFPILGNLTKNLGPRVGTIVFFARRNWDQVKSFWSS